MGSELWHVVNTSEFWMVVFEVKTCSVESIVLHSLVVPCADSVDVRSSQQFGELFFSLILIKDVLNTVVVFTHIVFVLENSKCTVDLVLVL